ncbi:tetratricopeptide repeat protein [Chthoniobacter sp.]|uniref:tetratricopeptide repeat protein n=1 Tax=Chthoniobacter sp. TaxID=2510640 RepID=UPI0032AF744F
MASAADWPDWRGPLLISFGNQLKEIQTKLEKAPNSPMLHSQRGDLFLFLGDYTDSIADFQKMIELDPTQDAQHWRLGIAYYFAGQYAKAQKQFEKYHSFDGHDRENGIWKFLAQERIDGVAKARAEMLTYTEFDREPFPALYEMYAGKRTPDEVLAEMDSKGLTKDPLVAFDGYYYTGLQEALLGHRPRAIELLRKAVDIMPGPEHVYMWNIARLQWERLLKEQAAQP